MIKVMFYQRRSKLLGGKIHSIWAKLILDEYDVKYEEENGENTFEILRNSQGNDLKINGALVLETGCANIQEAKEKDAITAIHNIMLIDSLEPEAILSMTPQKFYEVIKATTPDEFEPKAVATPLRNVLYYGIGGEDNSVLLVAYSEI